MVLGETSESVRLTGTGILETVAILFTMQRLRGRDLVANRDKLRGLSRVGTLIDRCDYRKRMCV